ncbi:MAG: TetR/AcrR family transcriptional regulator [Myxococcota bacterium]
MGGQTARSEHGALRGRRREESERRRLCILDAARRCFGEQGYAGATVARIAEEAGVSHGLLYQFFRNKDELFQVVLRDIIRDWVRAMVPEDEDEPALVALEGMFRRSVEFCQTHPLLPALMSGDPALRLTRIGPAAADRIQPHRDLVGAILRRGVDSGELRADLDVESVADLICHLQSEYSRRAYMRDPSFPLTPGIIDAVVRFMQDAVRAG